MKSQIAETFIYKITHCYKITYCYKITGCYIMVEWNELRSPKAIGLIQGLEVL